MPTIKEQIETIRISPKEEFNTRLRNIHFDADLDSIEDLICLLFAGSVVMEIKSFETLSTLCLSHPQFYSKQEYAYFYHLSIGHFYRFNDDFKQAIVHYEKLVRISHLLEDPELRIKALSQMGAVHSLGEDFQLAHFYISQAMELIDQLELPAAKGDVWISMGVSLVELKNYKKALEAYEQAEKYYKMVPGYERSLHYCLLLVNRGEAYLLLDELDLAEKNFLQGLNLAKKYDHDDYLMDINCAVSDFYQQKGEYKKALDHLNKYIEKKRFTANKQVRYQKKMDNQDEKIKLLELENLNDQLKKKLRNIIDVATQEKKVNLKREELIKLLNKENMESSILTYFQQKWSISENRFFGAEALVRWKRQDGMIILPEDFIPFIENTEWIFEISKCVIKDALQFCRQQRQQGLKDYIVSVNISSYQLTHGDLSSYLERQLFRSDVPPENLELEITESSLLEHKREGLEQLKKLKKLGVLLALDDFGTGYSSLSCMDYFPLDMIKLDKSFLEDCLPGSKKFTMLQAIIHLIKELNMESIIEGVETEEQLEIIKSLNCDKVQGFLFSSPQEMPLEKE